MAEHEGLAATLQFTEPVIAFSTREDKDELVRRKRKVQAEAWLRDFKTSMSLALSTKIPALCRLIPCHSLTKEQKVLIQLLVALSP